MSNPELTAALLRRFQRWRYGLELDHAEHALLDEVAAALAHKVTWAEERVAYIEQLEEENERLKAGHSPDCDLLNVSPEGIRKPCNCLG